MPTKISLQLCSYTRLSGGKKRSIYLSNALQIQIDRVNPLLEQPDTGHNRWPPDIHPVIRVAQGEVVTLQTRDALDGMVGRTTGVEELIHIEMGRIHPLTGPVYVEGAEPGDV